MWGNLKCWLNLQFVCRFMDDDGLCVWEWRNAELWWIGENRCEKRTCMRSRLFPQSAVAPTFLFYYLLLPNNGLGFSCSSRKPNWKLLLDIWTVSESQSLFLCFLFCFPTADFQELISHNCGLFSPQNLLQQCESYILLERCFCFCVFLNSTR